MKRIKLVIVSLVALFVAANLAGCSRVPAGNVGVKVNMLGGSKGVDYQVVKPGLYWMGPNTELFLFPTFTQNYVWTADLREGSPTNEELTFQTVEGLSVAADVGISYHIDKTMVGPVFEKYRKGVDEITDVFLRNMVRDAFVSVSSTQEIETVYGRGKSEMLTSVEEIVRNQCAPLGIIVEKIYLVGDLRLPPQIVEALNSKIAATQRAQQRENEVREAEAQGQKEVALATAQLEIAKLQAEANTILNKSLSPTLVSYKTVEKWNGILPTTTGGAIPMLNIAK